MGAAEHTHTKIQFEHAVARPLPSSVADMICNNIYPRAPQTEPVGDAGHRVNGEVTFFKGMST